MIIWKAVVAVAASIALLVPPASGTSLDPHHYDNQIPYGNPASTPVLTPPDGYTMTFLETVQRHGARSLTSTGTEKDALALWTKASRTKALTSTGKHFKSDLLAFQKGEKKIGYGHLSGVGATELAGIGRRTAASYLPFFTAAKADGDTIHVVTSPVTRTKQSAAAEKASIVSAVPGLTYSQTVDEALVIGSGATKKGNAAIAAVKKRATVKNAATALLKRLYTARFVKTIKDPVAAAMDVYLLYCTAPGMKDETKVTFSRYVPSSAAATLGSFEDAKNFYRYGPGVKGEKSSYAEAQPVLDDFLSQLDARLAGGHVAAVLRFGHGETMMPFEALLQLPGSDEQLPTSTPFSYGVSSWRGYVAGRLAGNVEWTAFTNGDGKSLVTMRYNEQPVKFRASCVADTPGGYFYTPAELHRCLG